MSHLDPDVAALIAMGETDAADEAQLDHLAECRECAEEVAAFTATVGAARGAMADGPLLTPPPRVWDAISAEVGFPTEPEAEPETSPASATPSVGAAQTRSDAHRVRRGARRRRLPLALALVGALAVVAVVAGVWIVGDSAQQPNIVAEATLDPFPAHEDAQGEALLEDVAGQARVVVTLDAPVPDDGHREVWLLTEDGSDLVSLGVLEGDKGTFDVPADVDLDRFRVVDVSQEADDGDPAHSGDSIVRGALVSA